MEKTYRILIIDDDPNARKILSDILKVKGYRPITAATGKEALDRAEEERPAAALVDLMLDDMSGLDVIKEMKACSPGTECIMITGYASKTSAIEAVNLGAYGYVQKPYDMDQLLLTIQRAIEKREAEEERIRFYNKIESLNIELENKVKERTRALEVAVQEAEEANKAKSNFLASMSHELRTPLNAIIGFSQMLRDRYFGELNEKQEEYVGHVLTSGEHLLELISDILDLAKVESGKLELEFTRVKIGNLLENSLNIIKEKILEHDISLDLDLVPRLADLEITVDELKLKQVMYNLLSNATKFTPDGGEILVSADLISDHGLRMSALKGDKKQSAIQNPKSKVEISVADTGVGIAPENREKVFEKFHQVKDNPQYTPGGTGLGLTLSKQFVEMHGGSIWVESEGKDRGSRFIFTLPIFPDDGKDAATLPEKVDSHPE